MKNPILTYREEKRLTQAEIGLLLDASQSAVAQWETGAFKPTEQTIKRLAAIFQIQPATLRKELDEFYGTMRQEVRKKLAEDRRSGGRRRF